MATVYDQARALAKALRECEEGRQMRRLAARVKGDQRLEALLAEFRLRQLEAQAAGLQGKRPSKESTERLQTLAKQIEGEAPLREYLTAETAYGRVLVEVQQVLGEAFSPEVPGAVRPSQQ